MQARISKGRGWWFGWIQTQFSMQSVHVQEKEICEDVEVLLYSVLWNQPSQFSPLCYKLRKRHFILKTIQVDHLPVHCVSMHTLCSKKNKWLGHVSWTNNCIWFRYNLQFFFRNERDSEWTPVHAVSTQTLKCIFLPQVHSSGCPNATFSVSRFLRAKTILEKCGLLRSLTVSCSLMGAGHCGNLQAHISRGNHTLAWILPSLLWIESTRHGGMKVFLTWICLCFFVFLKESLKLLDGHRYIVLKEQVPCRFWKNKRHNFELSCVCREAWSIAGRKNVRVSLSIYGSCPAAESE